MGFNRNNSQASNAAAAHVKIALEHLRTKRNIYEQDLSTIRSMVYVELSECEQAAERVAEQALVCGLRALRCPAQLFVCAVGGGHALVSLRNMGEVVRNIKLSRQNLRIYFSVVLGQFSKVDPGKRLVLTSIPAPQHMYTDESNI